jgi:hypothetical protein
MKGAFEASAITYVVALNPIDQSVTTQTNPDECCRQDVVNMITVVENRSARTTFNRSLVPANNVRRLQCSEQNKGHGKEKGRTTWANADFLSLSKGVELVDTAVEVSRPTQKQPENSPDHELFECLKTCQDCASVIQWSHTLA